MPRLVNAITGVFVNVSDETAANLGQEWSVSDESDADDKPARRTRKSS